ncbi:MULTISPECIES: fimbrial protein [Providencia]|uniref:Type 1 fimbrial protein n=1 Tax=Providencia rettgeri TaxID=587 RepID=A0A427HNB1_PRORE|nr:MULTISPECIES: fimbrial protein [Providencia]ELR5076039.1 type 1 fimbrial protein [Providencia stuartii]ELR5068777.1 type 1 fimbrial protein [Providencia rettgeri]ELR5216488.1 type 1 fimbrial protein [Providencia rettgeri]ELR5220922.1 type 1 fimbrial protein [Providencia rettgeri]MBV2191040.1 type 1 fimbrial protein [Providencia rettgeri]
MSILKKSLTVIGIALAVTSAPIVFASGTINFTGEITDIACTVDSNSKNLNVDLGKVSVKSLATQGEVAGLKDFTIKLVDCPANSKVTVQFSGTRDTSDRDILAINQAAGVANNVGIALFEKDATTQIKLFENSKQVELNGSTVDLDYVARYKATGVATAGPVNSSAVYSIQYH